MRLAEGGAPRVLWLITQAGRPPPDPAGAAPALHGSGLRHPALNQAADPPCRVQGRLLQAPRVDDGGDVVDCDGGFCHVGRHHNLADSRGGADEDLGLLAWGRMGGEGVCKGRRVGLIRLMGARRVRVALGHMTMLGGCWAAVGRLLGSCWRLWRGKDAVLPLSSCGCTAGY